MFTEKGLPCCADGVEVENESTIQNRRQGTKSEALLKSVTYQEEKFRGRTYIFTVRSELCCCC